VALAQCLPDRLEGIAAQGHDRDTHTQILADDVPGPAIEHIIKLRFGLFKLG